MKKDEIEYLQNLIENPNYIKLVRKNLAEVIKNRNNGRLAGIDYKRDWYDRLESDNQLTLNFFLANILSIWKKRSSLSAEKRKVIRYVCDLSGEEYTAKFEQTEKAENV
jgi:hypothetical protein